MSRRSLTAAPVGILLAAGCGRRFDPTGVRNKLLESLPDGSLIAVASARTLCAALPTVIAVVRPGQPALAQALTAAGCIVTICADAADGMGISLAHAVRFATQHAPSEAPAWIIALADMPYIAGATIHALCAALADGATLAVPMHLGRRGNPVAFHQSHLPALLALQGDQGARRLLHSADVREVAVCDPGILRDVDTTVDLV